MKQIHTLRPLLLSSFKGQSEIVIVRLMLVAFVVGFLATGILG